MDEYVGNDWPGVAAPMPRHGHRWIDILQKERGQVRGQSPMIDIAYVPTMCNHCDDAPCMKADKSGAISKRDDGIVIIDPVKAKGHKELVERLPLRPHLVERGVERCRRPGRSTPICSTRAGSRPAASRPARPAPCARSRSRTTRWRGWRATQGLEVMKPELGTKPRVYYRNLWRYSKCFIGGTVSAEAGGTVDCVEGATVRLTKDGKDGGHHDHRQLRRLQVRQARRRLRPLQRRGLRERPQQDGRRQLGASVNLGEIRL